MLRETAAFSRVSPLTAVLAPQPSCSRATTENVRHKLFCGSTSPPFGHLSCPRRGKAYQQPAGVAAIMLLLREPEGCDSQPGASPWARAARILPAAMSIPGRQARYSFPPRHSFRALQWTARKRSPQATRLIPHLFGHLSCPKRGKAYQPPAGVTAIMLLLREPEGCDSQPGASPWARAARILPAAMSIPGRQARYSFPPRHSFRALQRTARKRSPQATRRICCFFSQRWAPLPGRYVASRPFRHRKNAPAAGASAFFIFYPIFKERGNTF